MNSLLLSVFSLAIFAAPLAHAQEWKGAPPGVTAAHLITQNYFRIRKSASYLDYEGAHLNEVQAATVLQREMSRKKMHPTRDHPLITNDASIIRDTQLALDSCPFEISAVVQSQVTPDPATFRLNPGTNPDLIAQCQFRLESLAILITRWNDYRRGSPAPEHEPKDLGVVAINPAIVAEKASGVWVLHLNSKMDSQRRAQLQATLESTWNRAGTVQIILEDGPKAKNALQLIERPGSSPAANRLGGDKISMDFNLQESEILVHELGHIFGFADCYVDRWDRKTETESYYELDPENIMCSLNGKLLPMHLEALMKAYGPKS